MDRNETIKRIRKALKRRSGKPWSVKGGRGTAYEWLTITITAPPTRCTGHAVQKPGSMGTYPEDFDYKDTGEPNGNITPSDQAELAKLLNLFNKQVYRDGVSIPAANNYYQEYIDRAEGRAPSMIGRQYWD